MDYRGAVPTPAEVLAAVAAEESAQPALTYYDDTPGPTQGERIEVSRRVLVTWVAKAANALQEGFDAEPGTLVRLALPAPHWRLAYWALAAWSVGCTVTLDPHEGADVLVTTDPDAAEAEDADEVVAVTLAGLAREFPGTLRTGVMDEAHELASYGDSFEPWDEPDPGDTALVHHGRRICYRDVVPEAGWPRGSRVLVTDADPGVVLSQVLHALAVRGSVVMVRGAAPAPDDPRLAEEGVDLTA